MRKSLLIINSLFLLHICSLLHGIWFLEVVPRVNNSGGEHNITFYALFDVKC